MRHHDNRTRRHLSSVRQRGVLMFITPILLLLILLLGTLMLDGARLYFLRSEMQSQVNAAATAAADAVQTCGGLNVSLAAMKARALTAAHAQGFDGADEDLQVTAGTLVRDENKELSFQVSPYIDQSNAVRVSYHRNTRISMLLPQSTLGGVDLDANATVRKEAVATISAAGSTADVNSSGLLGGLLGAVLSPGSGSAYSLDATSLSSLENTTVKVGDLLGRLGVNDAAELLPLSGDELANALSEIASGQGMTEVANLLDQLASTAGINTIKVSDVISVVGKTAVPANSQFPLYDVVISLVLNLAKAKQAGSDGLLPIPLSLPNLDLGLPGLLTVASIKGLNLQLHVGEPPTIAIGPARRDESGEWKTRFYAPDVTLQLKAEVKIADINLGLIGISLADLEVPLAASVGGGHGDFVAADCARAERNSADITVELHREVARIATGKADPDTGEIDLDSIGGDIGSIVILGIRIPIINLEASLDTTVAGVDQTVSVAQNYPLYCDREMGCSTFRWKDQGDGISGLDLEIEPTIKILNQKKLLGLIDLNFLRGGVTDVLKPVINTAVSVLAENVINPLLKALGVGLSGISVAVSNVDQSNIQLIEDVPVAGNGT